MANRGKQHPGRARQEQEEISRNHVPRLFLGSVHKFTEGGVVTVVPQDRIKLEREPSTLYGAPSKLCGEALYSAVQISIKEVVSILRQVASNH